MNRLGLVLAGALFGAIGYTSSASASLIPISSVLTVDGYTFQIQSCGGSACGGLDWQADGSPLGIVFEEASGGAILSATGGSSADVSFQFSVTGPGSTVPAVNQVGVLVNGAVNGNTSTVSSGAFVSETVLDPPNPSTSGQQNLNAPETYYALAPGFSSLDVSKDVHINAPGGDNTTTITAVYQDFVLPEPASIAVMLAGLTAAFAARRKRRAH
jgi:hypothetical protein